MSDGASAEVGLHPTKKHGATRQAVLDDLTRNGPVVSPSGQATRVLIERMRWTGSASAITQTLLHLEREDLPLIKRDMNGRRCFRIERLGAPALSVVPEPDAEPEPEARPRGSIDGRCAECMQFRRPCALHRLPPAPAEPEPAPSPATPVAPKAPADLGLLIAEVSRDRENRPAEAMLVDEILRLRRELNAKAAAVVPPSGTQVDLAKSLSMVIHRGAEEHEEFIDLQGQYAALVDAHAMALDRLGRAHETIGQLRRSNELLGQRLARQTA